MPDLLRIILVIATSLLLLGLGIFLLFFRPGPTAQVVQPDMDPLVTDRVDDQQTVTPLPDLEQRAQIPIRGRAGDTLQVQNFLQNPEVTKFDQYTFQIARSESIEEDIHQIFYFADDQSITISLRSEPLDFARQQAERDLLRVTGLEEAEICLLTIQVTTPRTVSLEYAGRNLGLSFCPFSVTL